tara:strand:+ start:140296 stop:140844 length:549 start_codon:yes stop_codon:yes gene_type:complete
MKYLLIASLFLFIACGSSQKPLAPSAESRALDQLLATKNFSISADWAYPNATASMAAIANTGLLGVGNTANAVNLIGNPNFLNVKGDSISAFLPYYGERQMGAGYGSDNGIEFNGIPETYSLTKDDQKQRYTMEFTISGKTTEVFNVTINFFPNTTAQINIFSSQRRGIRYQGNVAALENEK